MGNIGRSSTGCGLCRKRKIKCDEGKPGCKKCAQIRKPCPGYPFSIELHLRPDIFPAPLLTTLKTPPVTPPVNVSETIQHAQSILSLPRQQSPTLPTAAPSEYGVEDAEEEVSHHPNAPQHAPLLESQLAKLIKEEPNDDDRRTWLQIVTRKKSESPCPPPKYDVQHQATCFFLNLFSFQASRLYGAGILDFLPEMLENASENSAVQQAARAVSRMTLADRYSGQDVRLQTGDEYLKALNAIKYTMTDSSEAVKDESVVAVWLLGLYEAVNSVLSHGREDPNRNVEEEWQSHIAHIRGAMHLLRLRGMSQFTNPRSEKIFRIFKAAIQMRLFVLNSVNSKDFGSLELDVYADEHEFVPSETANKASKFFVRSARHVEKIKQALQRLEESPNDENVLKDLEDLLQQGEHMDTQMEGWSKTDPGWDMMRVQANTANTMWALYPSHALYYFYSFWIFLYWLRFLIARVKLFEALIEIVKIQQSKQQSLDRIPESTATGRKPSTSHFDFQIQRYATIIQLTAADLIGLTAYALGDVTNAGTFHSSATGHNPLRGWREVNVVAAMQLVIPLKVLQRSPYPQARQKGAIDLAISHIGDGFRRQPIVV